MKRFLVPIGLLLLSLAVFIAGLCLGSASLMPGDFIDVDGTLNPICELRLIRMSAAFVVGASLALSGAVFQAVLRNPLAEPYTLGLSGGAGIGATLSIIFGLGAVTVYAIPCAAWIGALIALSLVFLVSRGGTRGSESLLLSGVIVGTICSGALMYLISIAQHEQLAGITWWMLGDLQSIDTDLLIPCAIVAFATLIAFRFLAGELNALSLGDDAAWYLGCHPRRTLAILVLLAAMLAAGTVALAGIIGFCGLIIPHMVRLVSGCDHRRILIRVFFAGGIFLMICDILSRIVHPVRELPIGVLTAIIGGPVFLWLLNRREANRADR